MTGKEMCELSREDFVDRTPGYAGDILYEHLIILQQENADTAVVLVNNDDHQQINPNVPYQEMSPPHPTPYYSDHYQPPPHWYQGLAAAQHHQIYAGEQYQPYSLPPQAFISIPPPHPASYYRTTFSVINLEFIWGHP